MKELTAKLARELLDYNPETGVFIWKPRRPEHFTDGVVQSSALKCHNFNSTFPGKVAGNINKHGPDDLREAIGINAKPYYSYRLAWLITYGKFPESEIDHINGNPMDNRIDNLREVTSMENSRNMRIRVDNKSGLTGVYWHKKDQVWRSQISVNGKHVSLGSFRDFFEACCCRKSAELRHGYHVNHGKRPKRPKAY